MLAKEADAARDDVPITPFFERFAALVAAAEREACAQVCEAYALRTRGYLDDDMTAVKNANAIRARGKHHTKGAA